MATANPAASLLAYFKGDGSGQVLGSEGNNVISITNRIRDLGAHFDISIPTLVFCGQQSAGKSSLIEALAGITLPRNDQTCTRCITEVRLTECVDEPLSVAITLRYEYDSVGVKLAQSRTEKFEHLDSRDGVEAAVRRAQDAILSADSKLQFTRNVVCVEIRGQGVGSLSLIDLPGLIYYTEKEKDSHYIEMIRGITTDLIDSRDAIIVACVTCKDDMANQEIVRLARKLDPEGTRTVGVLTKADTIEPGCQGSFLETLKGTRNPLHFGWFLVKTPSQLELEALKTHADVQAAERTFFASTEPWRSCGPELKARLGTSSLRACLSELLKRHISEQIPDMRRSVASILQRSKRELHAIPPVPDTDKVKLELLTLIKDLEVGVQNTVLARGNDKSFWTECDRAFDGLRSVLESTRPHFRSDTETSGRSLAETKKLIDECRGRQLPGTMPYDVKKVLIHEFVDQWMDPCQQCVEQLCAVLQTRVLKLVADRIGRFKDMYALAEKALTRQIAAHKENTRALVAELIQMEHFERTTHKEELDKRRASYLAELCELMAPQARSKSHDRDRQATTFQQIPPSDHEALLVMACVQGYFDIAFHRVSDMTPLFIDNRLLRGFANSVGSVLLKGLNVMHGREEDLARLFEEDPLAVQHRQDLTDKVKRLTAVLRELAPFGGGDSDEWDELLSGASDASGGWLASLSTSVTGLFSRPAPSPRPRSP